MAQDCPPGMDKQQYNKHHDAHILELFKFKGMKTAARYKKIGGDENAPQQLAVFSFDSFEDFEKYDTSPEHAAAAKVPGRPEGVVVRFRAQYELIRSWGK